MLRDIIARLDAEADKALEAIEQMETEGPEDDLIDVLESLKEAITDYQQTKGWI